MGEITGSYCKSEMQFLCTNNIHLLLQLLVQAFKHLLTEGSMTWHSQSINLVFQNTEEILILTNKEGSGEKGVNMALEIMQYLCLAWMLPRSHWRRKEMKEIQKHTSKIRLKRTQIISVKGWVTSWDGDSRRLSISQFQCLQLNVSG